MTNKRFYVLLALGAISFMVTGVAVVWLLTYVVRPGLPL